MLKCEPFSSYCELCQKGFSGPTSAEQHYRSEDHQKRARHGVNVSTSAFDCDVCHAPCNSSRQRSEHNASPAHKERLRRQQQQHQQLSGYSAGNNLPESRPSRPYDFDGNCGICYVCNIELTSPQHARQHLNGAKHKKKESQNTAEISSGTGSIFCSICAVPFTSEGNALEHFRSAKHIKKEQDANGQRLLNTGNLYKEHVPVQQIVPGVSLINAFPVPNNLPNPLLPQPGVSLINAFPVPNNLPNPLLPQPGISSCLPIQNNISSSNHSSRFGTSSAVEFNGLTGYCLACQVDLSSPQMKEQHISGSRHEKSMKQWPKSNTINNTDFKCDECGVSFSGPAPMQQHFSSEKHKKKSALPQTNFSINEPIKDRIKFQIDQSVLFPKELFPTDSSEENIPLNIPPDSCTEVGETPLHTDCSNQCPSTVSPQNQSDGDLLLKADGGNIFGIGVRQNNELNMANNSSNFQASYSQASSVLNSMIAEQNEQDIRITRPFTFSGDHGWCNICNVELKSVLHAHDHLTGKDHLLRVTESDSSKPCPQSRIDSSKIYSFDGNVGYCNVCHIALTSEKHANQHLNGKPHQKAIEQFQSPVNTSNQTSRTNDNITQELNKQEYRFDGSQGFCNVCNIHLTSKQHADQHLQGKKHIKAKMCWTSPDQTLAKTSSMMGDIPEYEFTGGRGFCFVCNIELTSNAHARQHIGGKNHKKTVERKQQQKDGNAPPLFCEVCHVQCSGPESALQHFNSAKHLQKMTVSRGGTSSSNSELSFPTFGMSEQNIKKEPNINNAAMSLQTGLNQVNSRFEFETCMDTNNSHVQTTPTELDSRPSYSLLRSLRPSPNNLSLSSKCLERYQSSDENPLISIESLNSKIANTTNYHQNVKQEMLVPEITTSSPIHLQRTCDIMPSGTEPFNSNANDENTDPLESASSCGQARRQQRYMPLHNRNHNRGTKNLFNLDDDASTDDFENLFDRLNITGKDDCSDNLVTPGNHGDGVSSSTVTLSSFDTLQPTGDSLQPPITCPPGSFGVSATQMKAKSNSYSDHFGYYCQICDRPMNSKDSYEDHMNGRYHQQKAANIKAPKRKLPPVVKILSEDEAYDKAFNLVKNGPRTYQVELFSKTMRSDRVIFLPTGTGKTLVAAMTVSYMLEANPSRPVLFLVDKVLLVLQQSKYLHDQLGNMLFDRTSPDNPDGPLESRKLKIATLCSGIAATGPTPLYQYDIIVGVAAYCQNLMFQERIYWSDFSLVVFDEAHHCTKRHPFNLLLQTYHTSASPDNRPKVLGLTASPAGKETIEATYVMLMELLVNLGNAKVGIVEGESPRAQLKKYQSNAKLHIKCEPRTNEEDDFRRQLLVYLVSCYLKLNELSNIDKDCSFMSQFKPKLAGGTTEESLLDCAEELNDPDRIKLFMHVLGMLKPKTSAVNVKANLDFLSNHTLIMLMSLQDMDGMGIPCSMEELRPLLNSKDTGNFDNAQLLGLNCDKLRETVKAWQHSALVSSEFQADEQRMSLVKQLLSSLQNGQYVNWEENGKPMALVLVRERVLALRLSKFLQGIGFIHDLGLKVVPVVGHGGGTADHGMRVKEQKRVLDGVKQKRYQIIVATSVAEEGIDIPECELVICMNLPGTVTGFVQMRGRARKKDSHFVIICNNKKEEEQMNNLLKREENMLAAAQRCVTEERKEENKYLN